MAARVLVLPAGPLVLDLVFAFSIAAIRGRVRAIRLLQFDLIILPGTPTPKRIVAMILGKIDLSRNMAFGVTA